MNRVPSKKIARIRERLYPSETDHAPEVLDIDEARWLLRECERSHNEIHRLGPVVTNRKQAIAIALSEQRQQRGGGKSRSKGK